ncbi:MAG: Hpt domain-containing protein [Xanthomonadaceae bacterium]|nr:Hpt domain-containing protein [Xanthomonadaceae bacterium]
MRLQDHIDFTTLQWVKPELDDTLAAARDALESYVDNPGNRDAMRSCADSLHQVHGTLQMVELYGAAMVADEMESLSIALLEDHVAEREEAYAALMRGLMQLPDYLERLSSGHRDVPVVLLPLLNDLRASRKMAALTEVALFNPRLDNPLPPEAPPAVSEVQAQTLRSRVGDLRLRFQQQLLGWFRGQSPAQQLQGMRDTLNAITGCCHSTAGRRLWWIAAGTVEGLEQGCLKEQTGEVRQLIGKVDRSIRQMLEYGEESLRGGDADDLARKLLFIVAQAKQRSPQMDLLRKTYALDSLLPDVAELEHARGSMAGHNRALLDSVSRALKDDLLRVKEALDLFLRQPDADPSQLAAQSEVLERVGDTLGMLALTVPRRVVNEQRRVLEEIASRMRSPEDETLLDVAGALLYVEASLDDHIESLGSSEEELASDAQAAPTLPRSEARHILSTLMQEATANTTRVKDAIVGFVESGWQHEHLADAPTQMDEVAGALRMLASSRPAELAEGIGRFIGNELLVDRRVPGSSQMDHLADALAALEYYLEAAREHRGGLEHILDVAEHSLQMLGYWPVPPARQPLAAEAPAPGTAPEAGVRAADEVPSALAGLDEELAAQPALSEPVSLAEGEDLAALFIGEPSAPPEQESDVAGLRLAETGEPPAPEPATADDDWVEIEEEVVEQRPVVDPLAATAGFQASTDGIDDDIRDIFLEEMQEEIDNLHQAEQAWLADPEQIAALTPVRRSFHTLKGSGRLVGASVLGEFAWRVENMLNRVLDHTVEPHDGVRAVVRRAIEALPQLHAALRGDGAPSAPLSGIMQAADQVAAGERPDVDALLAVGSETVRRVVRRRVPRAEVAAGEVPQATLAQLPETPAPATEPSEIIPMPVLPPVDSVLLEILRSEVAQYLQTIRSYISRSTDEMRVEDGLLRAVHTLHGAIAMVDIPMLTQLLSPLESLLKRLRAARVPLSSEGVHLLSQSADVVGQVMAQFDAAEPQLPDCGALIARITELRDTQPEPQVAHAVFDANEGEQDSDAGAPDEAAAARAAEEEARLEQEREDAAHSQLASEMLEALNAFDPRVQAPASDDRPVAHPPVDEAEFAALFAGLVDGREFGEGSPGASPEAPDQQVSATGEVTPADVPVEDRPVESSTRDDAARETPAAGTDDAMHGHPSIVPAPESSEEPESRAVAAEAIPDATGATGDGDHLTDATAPAEPAIAPDVDAEAPAEADAGPAAEGVAEPDAAAASTADAETAADAAVGAHDEARIDAPVEDQAHAPAAAMPADAEAVSAAAEDETGEVWRGDIDPDLLEVFTEEAREILDHADGALAAWRADPADLAQVPVLQRDLHTLKGGARIAGFVPVGDLSHAIETLLEQPISGEPDQTATLIGALEGGFDQLHALVQRIGQNKGIRYPQELINQLLALAGEEALVDHDEDIAPAPLATAPSAAVPVESATAKLPELLSDAAAEGFDEARSPQEQIRVRADLLDNLVNHAGEVAIYRSRLEQQVAGYRFNLVELEQTVSRLRSQLRMLEIETEAQIIARFQREHREAGIGVFDPLELDRFSQLQQYSRALAESVSDLVSIQGMLDELTRQSETLLIQQSRVSADLQEGLLRTRMLPFDTMVPNLRRTLRQAAQEEGKRAQLFVEGAHGEMDRNLLDRIKAPFEHMLRNAIAHGIESPDDRRKAGKPEEGAVRIRVAREATEVVIRVTDDGRGLNREAIRKRGVERGMLRAEARPSDDQLLALITQPGFSTASAVTQLAGRGVGMDVVANEIKQLGGSLSIESQEGRGTTFVLRLPFTLAVTQAILVRIGESTFAIPMTSVQGVARITPDELAIHLAADEPSFLHGGEDYGIHDLAELLGLPSSYAADEPQLPLLLTRAGDLRAAIRIDEVIGSREIVVKSVGPQVSSVPGLLGATIMGDGSVLMILDLPPLVRHGIARREQRLAEGLAPVLAPVVEEVRTKPLVMVVDDSITMRKVTGRVLERHDYEVNTAKDGVDALEKLHEQRVPDLMLLDIEMPRMDGYELAERMKADPRLREVPIIMITSRTGEKHRQRAFDIGVSRYLGKPYQEAELLAQIGEVLEQKAMELANG